MSIHKVTRKNGVSWKVVVTTPNGQDTKTFRKKADAEAFERERLSAFCLAGTPAVNKSRTVGDACTYWIENHAKATKTDSARLLDESIIRNHILPFLGHIRVADLDKATIRGWISNRRQGGKLKAKTANNILGALKAILAHEVQYDFLRVNPAAGIRALKTEPLSTRFWTIAQAQHVLAFLRANGHEHEAIVEVALKTGLRRGELKALMWDCIDFSNAVLTVRRTYCFKVNKVVERTKSHKSRHVPIESGLLSLLKRIKESSSSELVFGDAPFDWSHSSLEVKRIAVAAGVPVLKFHDLRHTFASMLASSNTDLYSVQHLLGHSTPNMTQRYAHLTGQHLALATDRLNF